MNTYISIYDYLRAGTGQDTATVLGNVSRIASPGISAGATSISLTTPTTVALNAFDPITIFDGANSEQVTVSTTTGAGASSLPVSATQYAHVAGTPLCSDGVQGSLAEMIVNASAQLETYCRQPLLQATYSNEELPLRTMRAAVTRDYRMLLRPKRFPVQSVSAATLQINGMTTVTLSTSYAQLDADAQLVTFTQMSSSTGTTTFWGVFAPPVFPTTPGFVSLSYTAGFAYAALPYDIKQACIWLVSDLLSDRQNPTGAAEIKLGNMQLVTRLRGETSGDSVLVIRAKKALDPYKQKPF